MATPVVQVVLILKKSISESTTFWGFYFEDFSHLLYLLFLTTFLVLLSDYDYKARNLLKTNRQAQENVEAFNIVLSAIDDFIWIVSLIVFIEIVVVILVTRDIRTGKNLRWFDRTTFYLLLGVVFTFFAFIAALKVRPLEKLTKIPVGHTTLWWLITGCLTVIIYTYSKQVFDERIFPKEGVDRPVGR